MWYKSNIFFSICLMLIIGCENQVSNIDKPISLLDQAKQSSRVEQIAPNIDKELEHSASCIFQNKDYSIPDIRAAIGDTISIEKVATWTLTLDRTIEDKAIREVTNQGDKFFKLKETNQFIAVGFLEDEGEYMHIYAYSINKETCEVLGKVQLAEETVWEHGYKDASSVFQDEISLIRSKNTGARDWGDYSQWSRDTMITIIEFDGDGKIRLEKI